jgi:hypothetical protein
MCVNQVACATHFVGVNHQRSEHHLNARESSFLRDPAAPRESECVHDPGAMRESENKRDQKLGRESALVREQGSYAWLASSRGGRFQACRPLNFFVLHFYRDPAI